MKWWGWGREDVSFTYHDKPGLAPFFMNKIGVDVTKATVPVVSFDSLDIPEPTIAFELREALDVAVGAEHVSVDNVDRVVHAKGKSLRDLIHLRRGDIGRPPDVVVYPGSEDEIQALVAAALHADAVVVAFGGGTNISGSLETPASEKRTVISVDLGRLNQVISVDETSQIAEVQAGVLGPDLETQLAARGWTMGHFPDSFTHSTLGGWIATRSSGMQSDKYGDIAGMVKAVRAVTPQGLLVTPVVPSTSSGPSVREMVLGSEGRLGIITQAAVQVHRLPEQRETIAYLFPNWKKALEAMHTIAASAFAPSVTRVSDANETQFSFATKKDSPFLDRIKSDAFKLYLSRRRHFDLNEMCLSFVGYEGKPKYVEDQKAGVGRIIKDHGGICIGAGPGQLYDQKKFDTPYIRDFLLDRGVVADVSETAAPWSSLLSLHAQTVQAAQKAFERIDTRGFVMCHLSHSYHTGACLYFTFAFQPPDNKVDALAPYGVVKTAIQQCFVDSGATLSHHHAVGTEHATWLEQDISKAGVAMIEALFKGVDPGNNFNPAKIVGVSSELAAYKSDHRSQ